MYNIIMFVDILLLVGNYKAKQPESGDMYDVWSGVGIPKAETKGRSCRCSYATPHEVITLYNYQIKDVLLLYPTVL